MLTIVRKTARIAVVLCTLLVPVLSSNCSTNSSCLLGPSCSSDHSTRSQLAECPTESTSSIGGTPSYNEYNISKCTPFKHCADRMELNWSNRAKVQKVGGIVRPVNVSHFTLDVYWDWYTYDFKKAQGRLVGYELRILNGSRTTIRCLCIREPGRFNISLALEDALEYKSSNPIMTIELSTFPYDGDWLRKDYTEKTEMIWPDECSGSEVCFSRLPLAPILSTPLMWTSLDTSGSELALAWTALPHIDTFYVNLENDVFNETLTFIINGSNNVKIGGLSPRKNWSVRIQGYSPCSGLAAYYSGKGTNIGCGDWSQREYIRLPGTTSTPSISSSWSEGFIPQPSSQLFLEVILPVALLVLLTALVVSVVAALCQYYWRNANKPVGAYKDIQNPVMPMNVIFTNRLPKLDALVLYSLSTPTHEKIEIEKYVVGFLKQQHFKVISCNDHTEKTIVQWVEENARLAHAVFVICNKQFGLDWKMELRPQLVNSLEMIVASAVGQNKIKKYATILLQSGDEKYIPDNLYFKGMKSFVVGSGAYMDEKANLASFIKFNSAIP